MCIYIIFTYSTFTIILYTHASHRYIHQYPWYIVRVAKVDFGFCQALNLFLASKLMLLFASIFISQLVRNWKKPTKKPRRTRERKQSKHNLDPERCNFLWISCPQWVFGKAMAGSQGKNVSSFWWFVEVIDTELDWSLEFTSSNHFFLAKSIASSLFILVEGVPEATVPIQSLPVQELDDTPHVFEVAPKGGAGQRWDEEWAFVFKVSSDMAKWTINSDFRIL